MYTVRPDALVRNFPPELVLVEITIAAPEPAAELVAELVADDAAAGVPVAALVALLLALLPLLHAAASSATPAAAPSRTSTGVRRNNESLIAFRLPSVRALRVSSSRVVTMYVRTA